MNYLKVAVYPLIVLICIYIIKLDWRKYSNNLRKRRISTAHIILISAIIGVYSLSYNHTFWWSDVAYYDRFFSAGRSFPDSVGLNAIYSFLHLFTNNIDALLFTVSFLATATMLVAYNCFQDAYPISMILMFFTTFFIATCQVSMKQAIACGLASLSICEVIKKKDLWALILILCASLFHVTAAPFLLITYLAIKAIEIKSEVWRGLIYVSMLLALVFFQKIFIALGSVVSFFPILASKMFEYTTMSGTLVNSSTSVVALKGMPYYLITILGFAKRREGRRYIEQYDAYLIVSIIASISYLLSFYQYWMTRVIGYYWLADLVFFGKIVNCNEISTRNTQYCKYFVVMLMVILSFRELILIYLS